MEEILLCDLEEEMTVGGVVARRNGSFLIGSKGRPPLKDDIWTELTWQPSGGGAFWAEDGPGPGQGHACRRPEWCERESLEDELRGWRVGQGEPGLLGRCQGFCFAKRWGVRKGFQQSDLIWWALWEVLLAAVLRVDCLRARIRQPTWSPSWADHLA